MKIFHSLSSIPLKWFKRKKERERERERGGEREEEN